jgi:hypothetical protein
MSTSDLTRATGAPPRSAAAEVAEASPVNDALTALTGELRQKLAALAGTPDSGTEMVIGLFPYGHRAVLESYKLITSSVSGSARKSEEDAEENPRLQVHLTDLGRQVIEACASSQSDTRELVERAQALHRRFSAELAFETEEAES